MTISWPTGLPAYRATVSMSIVAEEFADENKHIPSQIKLAHGAFMRRGGYQPKPKRIFSERLLSCSCAGSD